MERETDTRQSGRKPVQMAAQCRTSTGLRDKGWISDLSAGGCCVTTNGLFVRVGVRVLVRPEGMEGQSGIIRWVEGNRAGIEFDRPIYGPVVEHFAAMYPAGKPVDLTRL